MRWQHWTIVLLVFLNAGFMTFDGIRAFVVGDYIVPKSGPHAGQLGAWSKLVQAVGIAPRSSLMKTVFVLQGAVTLGLLGCYLLRLPWASAALLVAAMAGLWYLPVGSVANALVIVLLLSTRTPFAAS
jgi:hypothetical protein